jgi:hypothetical protein
MKIKSPFSLFVAFWMASSPAFADDTNVPSQNPAPSVTGSESTAVNKDVGQGASSTGGSPNGLGETPTNAGAAAVSNAAAPEAAGAATTGQSSASSNSANTAPASTGVVRVPYVPEAVMREIKDEIRQEVLAQAKGERWGEPGALPDWLSRISWFGDFRLRYERDGFPAGNALPSQYNPIGLTLISNTTDTQNYLQIQAHLGMNAKVSDNTFAVFRLSTGTTTNPASDNQTFGNGYNKDTVLWDRAYVQSAPYTWLTLSGGKMPNPWLSTNLLWDPTVDFDGVAAQLRPRISEEWRGYLTAGAFPYQHIQSSDTSLANSKWLYAAQLSAMWTAMDSSTAQFGLALYDFRNVEGIPNLIQGSHFYDGTAAQTMQKGNSLMYVNALGDPYLYGIASKFHELDLTAKMDWAAYDPVHVMLAGDYVKNLGFDATEIANRTGQPAPVAETTGYQAMLSVGSPRVKQRGDWQASLVYKYVERDAVLDALTDSLFHLGGTNAKGFIIGGSYGLDNETNLEVRWISSDQVDGPPLSIDSLVVDVNVRF